MIPEFSYCEVEDFHGLFCNRRSSVVVSRMSPVEAFRKYWYEEWYTKNWFVEPPTKLLIPGGLI